MYEPISQRIIVSRDVVFEEDSSLQWDKEFEKSTLVDLEWEEEDDTVVSANGDATIEVLDQSAAVVNQPADTTPETISSSDVSISNDSSPSPIAQRRERRQPAWMKDYTSGEGLSEKKEDASFLAMMATSTDPVHFEDDVRSASWRTTMDAEIAAIEKNNTRELTNLPDGAKKVGVNGSIRQNSMNMVKLKILNLDRWQRDTLKSMV
ncbi:uncharacterized protein LOC113314291 [Papaver somniferum]|uniref:uncharacterized protein LOC113314291 n=1 Tax=Papaver somniferum TaxID=3469 RepID=UPI000E70454F|nr:uncharacterized protein LOC113314291 [Papaver somniferum]